MNALGEIIIILKGPGSIHMCPKINKHLKPTVMWWETKIEYRY